MIRHAPSSEPKFHHDEMFVGVGKSMKESFKILISGCDFRMLVIRGSYS